MMPQPRPRSRARPILILLAAIACAAAVAAAIQFRESGRPTVREVAITHRVLGPLTVYAPAQGDELQTYVVYLYDDAPSGDGAALSATRRASVERLVARGAAVVPIATAQALDVIAKNTAPDAPCLFALGEFEGVSTLGQRALGDVHYRWPVLLGDGTAAGTLAYLALAQAPANTAAGAVSLGFDPTLASPRPLCAGATATQTAPDRFTYAPKAALPGQWIAVELADGEAAPPWLPFVKANPASVLREAAVPGGEARLRLAEDAVFEIGQRAETALSDLPLVELPAKPGTAGDAATRTVAIFVSGDGGWRDIDKSIAEVLVANGVGVVGVDALRYFWTRKTPETIAADLERIATAYGQRWQATRILLLGFSMGADALPFAWDHLSPTTRERIRLIALIGFEPTAAFEISIAGFVGVASDLDVDVRPAVRTLPLDRVLCIFGSEEKAEGETGCTLPEMKGATLIEMPGGHHLGGDYDSAARAILKQMK